MADKERKWIKRCGKRFYPYTDTEAVLNPDGSPYENLEERLQNIEENGGGTQGLPKILTVVHFTNDAESNPLPQDAEEGAYAVADGLLFMKTNGGWVMQEDPKYFFFKYEGTMYSYSDGDTKEEFDFGGSGGDSANSRDIYFVNGNYSTAEDTNGSFNTNEDGTEPKGIDLSSLFEGVEDEIDNINKEDYRKNMDEENEKLYPEYWFDVIEEEKKAQDSSYVKKNIVYAKNYYDWNTVKYNADIDNDEVVVENIQETTDIEVLYPTEHLATTTWYNSIVPSTGLDTRYVYYHENLKNFVLKVVNEGTTTYYKNWANSYLWKNSDGSLRKDTVYSRITLGAKSSGSGASTYFSISAWIVLEGQRTEFFNILRGENNEITRIDTTLFTDFKDAIERTMLENDGKCRLHSTKIYGSAGTINMNSSQVSKVDFDGQGAIICRIPKVSFKPEEEGGSVNTGGYGIQVKNVTDVAISNVKILAMRIAISNSASNMPASYSGSNVTGIHIDAANNVIKDVRLKNIETRGGDKDLRIGGNKRLNKVIIEDWKSTASEGAFFGGIENLVIDRADLYQGEMSCNHLLYCGDVGNAHAHVIKNSRFIQNSKINDNFVQYKTEDEGTEPNHYDANDNTSPYSIANLKFINCHMRVGRGMLIYSPKNELRVTIDNCTIQQHDKFETVDVDAGNNTNYKTTVGFWDGSKITNMSSGYSGIIQCNVWCSLSIKNSTFKVYNRPILMNGLGIRYYNISQATPMWANLELENVNLLLNDLTNYATQHAGNDDSSDNNYKLVLIYTGNGTNGSVYGGYLTKKFVNVTTNYTPPSGKAWIAEDTVTLQPKASGEYYQNRPLGFSYFNTTLGEMVWLSEKVTVYDIWTTADGTKYDRYNNEITSYTEAPSTIPKPENSSGVGFIYYNTEISKYLVLYSTAERQIWMDNEWNTYTDDGASFPCTQYDDGNLSAQRVGYSWYKIPMKQVFTIVAKATIPVNGVDKVFVAFSGIYGNNTYYYQTYKGGKLATKAAYATSDPAITTAPAIGAAYYNTRLSKVLFYVGKVGVHRWTDGDGHVYDYGGTEIQG